MLIENTSKYLLKKTRAKAKMYEYNLPEDRHLHTEKNVSDLLLISIGAIGNISVAILKDPNQKHVLIEESKLELEFASKFFDSYLNSRLDDGSDNYYLLFGSVAYFLCEYIGSSKVLANKININSLDLEANGIEVMLAYLLNDNLNIKYKQNKENPYDDYLLRISIMLSQLHLKGRIADKSIIQEFRKTVYEIGTPIELLLVDVLLAICILKMNYSAYVLLPKYTNLDSEMWEGVLSKGNFIRELWPAQRKLGDVGILRGKSAVIQMPTSSGKTKSISLAICSAFLSKRAAFAVVVAPFRALCREISSDLEEDFKYDKRIHVDEISDVMKLDTLVFDTYSGDEKTILVLTPEKLIYLLRQRKDLINRIGIIIFDESHLFDDPHRGATYELLISTIKGYLRDDVQKILVSAVIPNVTQLNDWMNGSQGVVIADNNIKSTEKVIAITDLEISRGKTYGCLYFINPENPDEEEFYVPRLIESETLKKLGTDRNERYFPELGIKKPRGCHNDVAIYHGLKLCGNGGVVVFSGRKDSANSIIKRIIDIDKRGYNISSFIKNANLKEVTKICNLIKVNYGTENIYYQGAEKAVFVHHAGISNGIKISVEFAMQKGCLNFLVCTSTLAQGVNLPIRYLVISSIYQGKNRIKVRDFHNLIGRAGRSGVFTEGNILLSETLVYKRRNSWKDKWRWENYKELINVENSEACSSVLLTLVQDCRVSDDLVIPVEEIINTYYELEEEFESKMRNYLSAVKTKWPKVFNEVEIKIQQIMICLDSVESFLMSYLLEDSYDKCKETIKLVLSNTLAYHLGSGKEKEKLIKLFERISKFIVTRINDPSKRYLYSKSLLGVRQMIEVESWINQEINNILKCQKTEELFEKLFPLIYILMENKIMKNIENQESVRDIGAKWIGGKSYYEILSYAIQNNFKIKSGKNFKDIGLDEIIGLCDRGFGYDCTLLISAVTEIIISETDEKHQVVGLLKFLSSQLRYGLNTKMSILIYEIGFSDRVVAKEVAGFFERKGIMATTKKELKKCLKRHSIEMNKILYEYPAVFEDRLGALIN